MRCCVWLASALWLIGCGVPQDATPTEVQLTDRVQVARVKRLGVNLGAYDPKGAEQILANLVPNPGFEPGTFASLWLAGRGSGAGILWPAGWGEARGAHAPGFWDGARYEVLSGEALGSTGVVRHFSHEAARYRFDLGDPGLALRPGDVVVTRRIFAGAQGMPGVVPAVDTRNPYSGRQSLRLEPGASLRLLLDSAWRDGDRSSGPLRTVQGHWRVRFRGRGAVGTERVRVRFGRESEAPFLAAEIALSKAWDRKVPHQLSFAVAPGTDPALHRLGRRKHPALVFRLTAPADNAGSIWIDELELRPGPGEGMFAAPLVARLSELRPGILRFWAGQLGDRIDTLLRVPFLRGASGFRPDRATPRRWSYGLHEFLQLCRTVGAEPWLVIPATASRSGLRELVAYLGAAQGEAAQRRAARGQRAPWTRVFAKIHLEWGNEEWGSAQPGDPAAGASVSGGVRLGKIASNRLAVLRQAPGFDAAKMQLVIGGQAARPERQREIAAHARGYDAVALAPYFGQLAVWQRDEDVFGPLFARPLFEVAQGRLWQSRQALPSDKELALYEINFHTTSPRSRVPIARRNAFVAGAAGALVLPFSMLTYQKRLGIVDQCAFTTVDFSYPFRPRRGPDDWVRIWGLLRDLAATGRARPTWLGLELANRAIRGDAVETRHGGARPGWTQWPRNGVTRATWVDAVQSFGFRDGRSQALVLLNLDLAKPHTVRLHLPAAPLGPARLLRIEPASLWDTNEVRENVHLVSSMLKEFRDGVSMRLPPHSIRALVWERDHP